MSKQIEKAWKSLVAVSNARDTLKSREKDLVQERKSLDTKLDELGAGDTGEHRRVSRQYVVCLRAIEYSRERLKSLADDADRIIRDAIQGKFEFADSIDEDGLVKQPSEDDLFAHDDDGEPKLEDARPVGRPGLKPKPEAPDPALADGEDQHLLASVNELDMREDLKGKAIAAGLTKIAHLAKEIDGPEPDLAGKLNVPEKDAKAVIKAVQAYRKAHRKAAMKAEGIES